MKSLTPAKEPKTHVSFRKRNGQIIQTRLNPAFSLSKANMYETKNHPDNKGYDTFPDRMNQLENDFNGPAPTLYPMKDVARLTIKGKEALNPEFIVAVQRVK